MNLPPIGPFSRSAWRGRFRNPSGNIVRTSIAASIIRLQSRRHRGRVAPGESPRGAAGVPADPQPKRRQGTRDCSRGLSGNLQLHVGFAATPFWCQKRAKKWADKIHDCRWKVPSRHLFKPRGVRPDPLKAVHILGGRVSRKKIGVQFFEALHNFPAFGPSHLPTPGGRVNGRKKKFGSESGSDAVGWIFA